MNEDTLCNSDLPYRQYSCIQSSLDEDIQPHSFNNFDMHN